MSTTLLDLQNSYATNLVGELIQATTSGKLNWTSLGDGITFTATATQAVGTTPGTPGNISQPITGSPVTWKYVIKNTPLGTGIMSTYTLEVDRNGLQQFFGRDNYSISDLYNQVQLIVLQLNDSLRMSLQMVQSLSG